MKFIAGLLIRGNWGMGATPQVFPRLRGPANRRVDLPLIASIPTAGPAEETSEGPRAEAASDEPSQIAAVEAPDGPGSVEIGRRTASRPIPPLILQALEEPIRQQAATAPAHPPLSGPPAAGLVGESTVEESTTACEETLAP
jgi:hypothetical protein